MDDAILDHEELETALKIKDTYKKIDEIPFDFVRWKSLARLLLKTER